MASTTKHYLKAICAYLHLHPGQVPKTELQLVQKELVGLISFLDGELEVGSEMIINITVNFNQFIMHSHCIINIPEVEQLYGVRV